MANGPGCPHGRVGHQAARKHEHEYRPPPQGQRQCSCGNRSWIVSLGGGLPVSVRCSRCNGQSRLNTLYELGRMAGRQEGWKAHQDSLTGSGVPF